MAGCAHAGLAQMLLDNDEWIGQFECERSFVRMALRRRWGLLALRGEFDPLAWRGNAMNAKGEAEFIELSVPEARLRPEEAFAQHLWLWGLFLRRHASGLTGGHSPAGRVAQAHPAFRLRSGFDFKLYSDLFSQAGLPELEWDVEQVDHGFAIQL